MTKLNAFHKDLIVLFALLILQLLFTALFPLNGESTASTVEISRNIVAIDIEYVGQDRSFTYFPVMTLIFVFTLLLALLKKEKPLTLIYGVGLLILSKFTFLSQFYQLEGTQGNFAVEGFLARRIVVDGSTVAQDISFFILLVLIIIKLSIVIYHAIRKHLNQKQTSSTENEAATR